MPEDQKGDVVAPATDKKETEEEDMDAPWMRFLIVFHQKLRVGPAGDFSILCWGFWISESKCWILSKNLGIGPKRWRFWDVGFTNGPEGSIGDIKWVHAAFRWPGS